MVANGGDDAPGDGGVAGEAQGIANRHNFTAGADVGCAAELKLLEIVATDFQDCQVLFFVKPHHAAAKSPVVVYQHVDTERVSNDVVVGQDQPLLPLSDVGNDSTTDAGGRVNPDHARFNAVDHGRQIDRCRKRSRSRVKRRG